MKTQNLPGKWLLKLRIFLLLLMLVCTGCFSGAVMTPAAQAEESNAEEINAEDIDAEDIDAEEINAEDIDAEDIDAEDIIDEETGAAEENMGAAGYSMLEVPDEELEAPSDRGILSSGAAASILGEILNALDQGERKIRDCEVAKIPDQTYTGKAIRPSVTITYLGYTLKRGTDYTLTYSSNTRVGTAKIKITGKGRYTGTKTVSFKIVRKGTSASNSSSGKNGSSASTSTKKFTVRLSTTSYVYNGKYKKPTVKVTAGGKSITARYYTVKYSENRSVGNATVTVTGKGDYKGYSGTATFKITPKRAVISSVKSAAEGKITVTVKKDAQVDGYQIEVCTRKTFSGTVKKVTLKDGTSQTITGLESGKKYYVRIRSYKKVGSTNWYSEYSTVRTVTVQ